MKTLNQKCKFICVLIITIMFFQNQFIIAQQQKLAQTGMKFLSVSLDARTSAFGDAITSVETNSTAMLYNPASMARLETIADVSLGSTQFIADIKYYNASAAFAPFEGDYGVFGINFLSVDYGELLATVRANNEQGFLDAGTFSPTAMSFGIGYAKSLSEKFSVGGNIKYVRQSLGTSVIDDVVTDPGLGYISGKTEENKISGVAFDFGILYKTGYKSLNIGMSVRNFSRELKFKEEGFQLPLTFQLGASFNFADIMDVDKNEHSFLVSIDANHPRDYPEQVLVGVEYTFMNMISFRGGFSSPNDERDISAGIGLKKDIGGVDLGVDYAYTPFGIFNSVHRITMNFSF